MWAATPLPRGCSPRNLKYNARAVDRSTPNSPLMSSTNDTSAGVRVTFPSAHHFQVRQMGLLEKAKAWEGLGCGCGEGKASWGYAFPPNGGNSAAGGFQTGGTCTTLLCCMLCPPSPTTKGHLRQIPTQMHDHVDIVGAQAPDGHRGPYLGPRLLWAVEAPCHCRERAQTVVPEQRPLATCGRPTQRRALARSKHASPASP